MVNDTSLFDLYFRYVGNNEAPTTFHRWAFLSLIGALLSRNVSIPFGHSKIYPNQYIILTGSPGARKGTAIKIGKNLLEELGYRYVAPNKAVKESFWKWMTAQSTYTEIADVEDMLDWDIETEDRITEAYVAHDEFLDFIGIGDDSFITNLANLWDNLPSFTNPKTRGKDVTINKPTINILSGMTPGGIADTFKSLAIGGGFFSRVLFIYSEPTDIKITFPDPPDYKVGDQLIAKLQDIRELNGELVLTSAVRELLDKLYKSCPRMSDQRFQYYCQRRFTHLLKLVIIITASRLSLNPTEEDCILANTILYNAELQMPSALGEYGKSKNSEVAQSIITALNIAKKPLAMKEIWKLVSRDLNKFGDLRDIIDGLIVADKIQKIATKSGNVYLPNNTISSPWPEDLIDFTLLKDDEHRE